MIGFVRNVEIKKPYPTDKLKLLNVIADSNAALFISSFSIVTFLKTKHFLIRTHHAP
jgi:hypothetical protein